MFSMLSYILGFKRSIGLGVALAALIVSLSRFAPAKPTGTAMQTAQAQSVALPQETESEYADDGADGRRGKEELFKALEMDENGFNWRKDWWKYLCIVLVGLLVVICGIRLTKMLFRLVRFGVCVLTGIFGAFWLGPILTPVIQPHIPERILAFASPELLGYAAGFALAYLIITIVIAFLPKTVREGGSPEK